MKFIDKHYFYNPHLMRKKPVIIEIGAYSIENVEFMNAHHVGCKYEIYEADPANFKLLEEIELPKNLKIFNKALHTNKGKDTFYRYQYKASGSMYARHITDKNLKLKKKVQVNTVMLKDIVTKTVDLLLLNCEGAELQAIKELYHNETVRKRVKQFCTSFHVGKCYNESKMLNHLEVIKQYYDVEISTKEEVTYYLFIRK